MPDRYPPAIARVRREMKGTYRLERTGGGHYRIRDRRGRLVEYEGKSVTLVSDPSPGVERAWREQLTATRVLRGTRQRPFHPEQREQVSEANRAANAGRTRRTQEAASVRRRRFAALFEAMGGIDVPGRAADLGHVAALVARETSQNGRPKLFTPDLLYSNAIRVINSAPVAPEYAVVWDALAERLEDAPDVVGGWYSLLREARGLPADTVSLRMPKGAHDDWPFRVELLPLDALVSDPAYQRPVVWQFVRREAARFDPSLVGTIDVAQRSPSNFAILDGQQRTQMIRLVGKETVWCSIYVGLDLQSEARFFLHKNANRKNVHPYYTFRALLASGDAAALETNEIVERHGYRLAIGAPLRALDTSRAGNIAAIAAVNEVYRAQLADGSGTTLEPVLAILRRATFGRARGQDSMLLRGVSKLLALEENVDDDALVEVVTRLGPELILGRAQDLKRTSGIPGAEAVQRVLLVEHDRVRRSRARKAAAA